MRKHQPLHRRVAFLATTAGLALAVGFAPGCGDSGGGEEPSGGTGRVAVLLTDRPTEGFTAVKVTFSRIELLSFQLPTCVLSTEPQTIDLLSQAETFLTLTIAEGVPEGLYDKLRLYVTSVVFTPEPAVAIRLPGNTLDLNPTGRFTVESGGTLVVSLDFDVAQTLSITSGDILRPVVFVDVATAVPDPPPPEQSPEGKLVRLRGPVEAVDEGTGDFHLCPATLPHCVHVRTDDAWLFRAGVDDVLERVATVEPGDSGQIVAVYGRFDLFGVEPGSDCASFSAAVAQIGEEPFLQRPLPGVIGAVAVDAETFEFIPEDGAQGVVDYSQARLFTCQGVELTPAKFAAALDPEQEAKVDGIYKAGAMPPGQAAIVLVSGAGPVAKREGTIVGEPDPHLQQFQARAENQEQFCVRVGQGTRLVRADDASPQGYAVTDLSFGELASGHNVAVFGPTGEACPEAQSVVAHTHQEGTH